MTVDQWLTIAVIGALFTALVWTNLAADVIMLAALAALVLTGVITTGDALSGFANEGMITVAVLFVMVAGLRDTAAMSWFSRVAFGRPRRIEVAQARMMVPLAFASAFVNNTPLVAAMVPAVTEWARKLSLPISKLMMPLSFATILGGLCTVIGTSTNVIVAGLSRDALQEGRMTGAIEFFTLAPVGIACAFAGLVYMIVASRWLLPLRGNALSKQEDPRTYTVEVIVQPNGPIEGRSIESAGLRHLNNMYLVEVERDGEIIAAVSPQLKLRGNDRLVFVGVVDAVLEVQRIRGLMPAADQLFTLDSKRQGRMLIEAAISDRCPLVGQSIRDGNFRKRYDAVVIAVARSGQRINSKIGDIVLQPGDVVLLEARPTFIALYRNAPDFYLLNGLPDSSPPRHDKAGIALAILIGMVLLATLLEQGILLPNHDLGILHAAVIAATLMLVTGCCSLESARRTIDWQVLVVIAAAIGIGKSMTTTGLAAAAAGGLVSTLGDNYWLSLAAIYFTTMLLTELLSNNSAAVLMFPVALSTALAAGVDPLPFVVAMTIAASCGFATPIGYQTNLIVYGPGGYRFSDYLRFGGPLNLIVAIVTLLVVPIVFPFTPS